MTAEALLLIPPGGLPAYWPLIADRIVKLCADCGERWKPIHVAREIADGRAKLWCSASASIFIITTVQIEPWQRSFHVWIACNDTLARAADYLPMVKTMARAHDCDTVTFESPRRWQRALPGARTRYLYTIEVECSQ